MPCFAAILHALFNNTPRLVLDVIYKEAPHYHGPFITDISLGNLYLSILFQKKYFLTFLRHKFLVVLGVYAHIFEKFAHLFIEVGLEVANCFFSVN